MHQIYPDFFLFKTLTDYFPGGPVTTTLHSQCRGPGSTPGQGTRPLQLNSLHVTSKNQGSQINKNIF